MPPADRKSSRDNAISLKGRRNLRKTDGLDGYTQLIYEAAQIHGAASLLRRLLQQ